MKKSICVLVLSSFIVLCFASCYNQSVTKDDKPIVVKTEGEYIPSENIISVVGVGKAKARPDVVSFNVIIDEVLPTTSEALESANNKVKSVYEILDSFDVKRLDTETSSLSIGPRTKYDYEKKEDVLLGQGVRQNIKVRIKNFKDDDEKRLGLIIDALGEISAIQINSINFSKEDEQELYKEARKLAIKKAMEKIDDYTTEAGVQLKQVKTITEGSGAVESPRFYANSMLYSKAMAADEATSSTSIVSGDFEVSSSVTVTAEFVPLI